MQTIYRLNARELDNQFLEALKTLFADKEIEIIVTEFDETSYLLGTPANRKRLLQALEVAKQAHNLIEISVEQHTETGDTIDLLSPDEYNAGQRIQPHGFNTL